MCRSVILLLFLPKKFRHYIFVQNLQLFDRYYRSTDFLETFPTTAGNEFQDIGFFPPNFGFSDNFFVSILVLGKQLTNTHLLAPI